MADLDVSDILSDPDFSDEFTVYRRPETVDDHGRVSTDPRPLCCVVGVFTVAGPDDLERLDDRQTMGRVHCLVTKFALRGPSKDGSGKQYQPDLVKFRGDFFIVRDVGPYLHFGGGFIQAIVSSIDFVDRAPAR